MTLNLKHLGCPSMSRLLLDNLSAIVWLVYPTKDSTVMFSTNLGAQAEGKVITDFTDLLTNLLPERNLKFNKINVFVFSFIVTTLVSPLALARHMQISHIVNIAEPGASFRGRGAVLIFQVAM